MHQFSCETSLSQDIAHLRGENPLETKAWSGEDRLRAAEYESSPLDVADDVSVHASHRWHASHGYVDTHAFILGGGWHATGGR